jgi:glycosyltransferase involved in cell wall biosynthesis
VTHFKKIIAGKQLTFFVAETYPSYAGGGRNAFNFARYLHANGTQANIVALNYMNRLTPNEVIDGVNIYRIPYYNNNLILKVFSLPLLCFSYIRWVIKSDIVMVYGRYLPGYPFIFLLGWLFSKPLIYRSTLLEDDDMQSISKRALGKITLASFSLIDTYFAINSDFTEMWVKLKGHKIPVFTHPQGVDNTIFYAAASYTPAKINQSSPMFVTNALLIERKGYRKLFEALSKTSFHFKLLVIGQYQPDPYHRSSKQELKEMKALVELGKNLLGSKVEFLNTVKDVVPILRKSDVFIYAGNKDGTPNSVLEAMAVGLPVIMYNSGTNANLFKHQENVILFNSFSSLPQILSDVLKNSELLKKTSANAAENIRKSYTFEQVANGLFTTLNCTLRKPLL